MYPFVKKGTVTQYLFCHTSKGTTKQSVTKIATFAQGILP